MKIPLKIIAKEIGWLIAAFALTTVIYFVFAAILKGVGLDINSKKSESSVFDMSQHLFLSLVLAQNIAFLICLLWRRNSEGERLPAWKSEQSGFSFITKVGIGVATAIVLLICVYASEVPLQLFFDQALLEASPWTEVKLLGFREKFVFLGLAAVFAPIVEELYFREVILGSIYRLGFPNFAIFFSCAVFGIIHVDFLHIFAYLIYGIGFSIAYVKTRSLIPSITAHILINSILLTYLLFLS